MKTTKIIVLLSLVLMSTACSEGGVSVNGKDSIANSEKQKEEQLTSIATCGACHGSEGVSSNPDWPNLAGQPSDYLYQQLRAFKQGKRVNPIMSATLLEGYSDEDLRSIADQYSKMTTVASVDENAYDLAGAHVRARCVSCHGMTGRSVTSLWPNLAGQQAGYLANQLRAYKSGERIHPTMQVIANELTEQQIKDVAEYYSKVNP